MAEISSPQTIAPFARPHSRIWHWLMAVQITLFAVVGIYAVWTQRYLYADGSHFLLNILESRAVADFYPARYFAHLLTQLPAVFVLRYLGCRDAGLVGATYGATLFLLPLMGLVLTWWAARRADAEYLAYPLVSFSILYLDVSFFIISEIHIAVSLFWPILYLLIFSKRLNLVRSASLICMAVCITRTYECYLLLAWPLAFAAIRRGKASWTQSSYMDFMTCVICLLLFVTAFSISVNATVFPRDPEMRTNFIISGLLHLVYPPVWFSLLTLAGVFKYVFSHGRERTSQLVTNLTCGCGLFVTMMPIVGFVAPPLQYIARIQGLYVPFLLGIVVTLLSDKRRTKFSCSPERHFKLWRTTAGACAVATIFQLGSTCRWDNYRSVLLRELGEHRGVIGFNQSAISDQVFERAAHTAGRSALWKEFLQAPRPFLRRVELGQFNWGWAMPSLCVALSATNFGSVSTIICAPESTGWQPFDPRVPGAIPDLGEYGVSTDVVADVNENK